MCHLALKKPMIKLTEMKHSNKLVNMGIQERMMELIYKRWFKVRRRGFTLQNKQKDLEVVQEGILSMTLYLVAINVILGELGNEVDGSFFTMI